MNELPHHPDDAEAKSVLTITDLIRAKLDTGKSVRDLARESGDLVKYQTFDEYSRSAPKSWPKEVKTIRGMARALGVTETAVVLAYAASLGVAVEAPSMLAQQLPPSTDSLSVGFRRAIVSLVDAAVVEVRNAATTTGKTHDEDQSATPPAPNQEADGAVGDSRTSTTGAAGRGNRKFSALPGGKQATDVDGRLGPPNPADILAAQTIDPRDASLRPADDADESQDRGSDDPA